MGLIKVKHYFKKPHIQSRHLGGKIFNEKAIRPDDLLAEQDNLVRLDREYLLDREESFVTVDCPACASKNHTQTFEKNNFAYHLCHDCQTVFMNPRPGLPLLMDFYKQSKNYEYWNNYIFPASEGARRESIFKPRVERTIELADKFLPTCDSILEIGAGFGIYCEELVRSGHFQRVIAVEPTPALAETCRGRELETFELTVENLPASVKADIIASFEVIEHLFSVVEFLNKCAIHLNKPGLVILSCPNIHGFDLQTLGVDSVTIDHEHLNYFNPNSIKILLNRCGFQVLELITPGKLDADIVRNRVLDKTVSLDDQPFLRTVLIERWPELGENFQKFLADNLLSGHMWVVAKRSK